MKSILTAEPAAALFTHPHILDQGCVRRLQKAHLLDIWYKLSLRFYILNPLVKSYQLIYVFIQSKEGGWGVRRSPQEGFNLSEIFRGPFL